VREPIHFDTMPSQPSAQACLHGQGQGTTLIRGVEDEAKARNFRQIVLETHDS
jgi:hypothetical protein